ncbi:MAG: hypothetical protein CMB48_05425 [Euryarchaeota archaeon]|nr:hypothetical protein [Euryarchaeota archaeon]
MFGMSNPEQVISQFERYAQEGRLEIAEVMSTELAERLLNEKKRDMQNQKFLVKTLRSNASILLQREKYKLSKNASKMLKRQRKILNKMAKKNKNEEMFDANISTVANDEIVLACAEIGLKKLFGALRSLNKANKLRPLDSEICVLMLEARFTIKGKLNGSKPSCKKLIYALESCGPVILQNGNFIFNPEGYVPRNITPLLSRLDFLCNAKNLDQHSKQRITNCINNINAQITAINEGEQAANARLAKAIDSLNPVSDYYSY